MSVKVQFTQYEIEKMRDCLGVLSSVESIRDAVNSNNYAERLSLELFAGWSYYSDNGGNVEFNFLSSGINKVLEAIDVYDYIVPVVDADEIKKIKALKDKLLHAVSDCGESWP